MKYCIYFDYFANETNQEFYLNYERYYFDALDDNSALAECTRLQKLCENCQEMASVKLCGDDPCFANHLFKYNQIIDDYELLEF